MAKSPLLLVIEPGDPAWDATPWAAATRANAPDRALHVWPDLPDPAAIEYALVWKPDPTILSALPNLKAIFSLGAGVDSLVGLKGLPDVPIVRVVNPDLTERMTEWVVLQVLLHHRRQRIYDRFQAERHWEELPQPPASAVRVGIMGLGVLGRAAGDVLARLGFRVAGWSRRPHDVPSIESFHGADGLDRFLARTDILVALLPLTPATRGILSAPLFAKLARDGALGGPVLINAGRGGLQVEVDIVAAIESGTLHGASLDVFEIEPLPPTSRLWELPNVVVSPHAAAASDPGAIVPEILREIEAHEAGAPLRNLVDREAFY